MIYHESVESIDREKWKRFCSEHLRRNAYQTFKMFEFWNSLENYSAFVLFAESPIGECLAFCTGVIATKGESKTKNPDKTALIYGGPLLKDDKLDLFDPFIKKLEKYLKFKSKYTEFRNLGSDLFLKEKFINNKWKYSPKLNYLVRLDSENEVFERFSRSRKQQIRKTLNKDIEISYEKTKENIKSTHGLLTQIFEKNDKTLVLPIPNLVFLSNLMKLENSGIVVLKHEGIVVAGGVFIYDDSTLYYWFRAGQGRSVKDMYPDCLADWLVMKYGIDRGISQLDFMGAGTKGWDNGIRTYKSRFGGDLVENGMYSKASFPLIFRIENKLKQIIAKRSA